MITSMSKADLFTTLWGYSDPAHNPYIKSTKVTAEIADTRSVVGPGNWKAFGDTPKPSETMKAANMDTFTYSDDFKVDHGNVSGLTFERNTDRLEISDEAKKALEACEDIEPYKCSEVVDFTNQFCRIHLEDHMRGGIPTEERIAEYYGNIAKRLDAAYSEGKFTKDEYDELNKAIADGMEWETRCAENNKAFFAIGQKRANLPYKMTSLSHIIRECIMSPEQMRAKMQAEISGYVSKYFKYDRSAILNMFNSVRYGK